MASSKRGVAISTLLVMSFLIPTVESYSAGISNVPSNGCICHNYEPTETVNISIIGLPDDYQINTTYTLFIGAENGADLVENHTNSGGFNFWISHGELTSLGNETKTWSINEISHTNEGNNQRNWTFLWTSPSDENIVVEYRLHVNTVNGDGIPSPDDKWNRLTGVIGDEIEPISALFLYGVPVVMIGLISLVYFREMRKLRDEANAFEDE